MKNYYFILGLLLSILSVIWLVYLVNLQLPELSSKRGEVAIATILFCGGIGLILFDAFSRNPQREKLEAEKKLLREEILAMLVEAEESQRELNVYINQTLGKTGFFGLELSELERVKAHVQRKISEKLGEKIN